VSAAAPVGTTSPETTSRIRLAAAALLLVGLAFVQDPGFLVADTKLDLAADPGAFLGRALHLWDGEGAFGQLQNQAYGYLWPMGPFFGAGSVLGLPGWVVQRLWVALVLVVALVGAARLAKALGVRSDLARLVVGVAFALSPRMLSVLGPISIEAWPSALAPWVLLPLVLGSRSGSPRRAAAWSAFAVAMVGGVNAAATSAVLPLGVLWLLTRTPGPRRRALMVWWPAFTLLATLWWLVPLFVLGAFSPPFLDFIETAAVTTFPTTPFDVLRGTSDWVPYISVDSRAGADLLTTPFLVLNGAMVLLLGLAGLLDRRTPHRTFLGLGVLAGLLLVGAGHVGATAGWLAGDVRDLLDGALAPLRNVHKFDVVLRLPLVLGLGFLLDRVVAARGPAVAAASPAGLARQDRLARVNQGAVVGLVLLVLTGSVVPALLGRIPPQGATVGVPDYWTQAADWLGEHSSGGTGGTGGTDLLVPGSAFGDYAWGSPQDEPMQWLASAPWAVRNVVPLTPPGNVRALDAIESSFVEGTGSPALLARLQRAGVDHLVVRNDLDPSDDVPDPVLVHAAIDQTAGLTRVATFGPQVGGETRLETADGDPLLINGGWQAFYPAVEVFEVPDAAPAVVGEPTVVVGGPEDVADPGIAVGDTAVLGADVGADAGVPLSTPVVLTDGLRQRERAFGRLHDADSPVRTPGDRRRTTGPVADYPVGDGDPRWLTRATLEGARSISASGSASDAGTPGGSRRGDLPYAALDGDPATQWVSAPFSSRLAWWQVETEDPLRLDGTQAVTLTGGEDATEDQLVRVRTEAGVSAPVPLGPGEQAEVVLPTGTTSSLRVEDASGVAGRQLALAQVDLPGLEVRRRLVLPQVPSSWGTPDRIVLRRDAEDRRGCVEVVGTGGGDSTDVRCVVGRERTDEEATAMRRTFTLTAPRTYAPTMRVTPVAGRDLDRLLLSDQPVDVAASSVGVPDPRASPLSAIDADPGTTWYADPEDDDPTLDLSWLGERRIGRIVLTVDPDAGVRTPTRLELTTPTDRREVTLVDGAATFPRLRTDRLTVRVLDDDGARSLDFDSRDVPLPVGISGLRVRGVEYLPLGLSDDVRRYPCGTGPTVAVDGFPLRTRLVASPAALARGLDVPARFCGRPPVRLDEGEHTVDVPSTSTAAAAVLVLDDLDLAQVPDAAPVGVESGSVSRTVDPGPGDASAGDVVVLRQNTNPGWEARQAGQTLDPVVVDGWQQAWRLDDRAQEGQPVRAEFGPDATYRVALGAGLALAVVFALGIVWSAVRRRRVRTGDRPEPPPLEGREVSAVVGSVVSVGAGGLVAGWAGAVVALVTCGVLLVLRLVVPARARRRPGGAAGVLAAAAPAAPYLLAAPVAASAVAYALRPWESLAGWAGQLGWTSLVVLVPVSALLVSASTSVWPRRPRWPRWVRRSDAPSGGRPGPTPRRRIAGRSTRR